eukprot:1900017-Rhodomonas_salina.1
MHLQRSSFCASPSVAFPESASGSGGAQAICLGGHQGQTAEIIPKGTALPVEKAVSVALSEASQSSALIRIFEGPPGPQEAAQVRASGDDGCLAVWGHVLVCFRSVLGGGVPCACSGRQLVGELTLSGIEEGPLTVSVAVLPPLPPLPDLPPSLLSPPLSSPRSLHPSAGC